MRPSEHGEPRPVRLYVIDDAPNDLPAWLSDRSRLLVHARGPLEDDAARIELPLGITARSDSSGTGLDVVSLRFDGPTRALGVGLRGLGDRLGARRRQTAVVLSGTVQPPAPSTFREFTGTGLVPGVDLTGFSWMTKTTVAIAGPGGIAILPLPDTRGCAAGLSELVVALSRSEPDSPAAMWTAAVAAGHRHGTADGWEMVLRSQYVEAVLHELR